MSFLKGTGSTPKDLLIAFCFVLAISLILPYLPIINNYEEYRKFSYKSIQKQLITMSDITNQDILINPDANLDIQLNKTSVLPNEEFVYHYTIAHPGLQNLSEDDAQSFKKDLRQSFYSGYHETNHYDWFKQNKVTVTWIFKNLKGDEVTKFSATSKTP
jgi:hypothetical protein